MRHSKLLVKLRISEYALYRTRLKIAHESFFQWLFFFFSRSYDLQPIIIWPWICIDSSHGSALIFITNFASVTGNECRKIQTVRVLQSLFASCAQLHLYFKD